MLIYGIISIALAALCAVFGARIRKGDINLIHSYHRARVSDSAGYCKAMGRAISGIGVSAAVSAAAAFVPGMPPVAAIGIFFAGFIICLAAVCRVQRKYNGGVF